MGRLERLAKSKDLQAEAHLESSKVSVRVASGSAGDGSRAHAIVVAVIVAMALLPCLIASQPPLYDYHHWVFHGHVLSALLTGERIGAEPLNSLFSVNARPVPNMAVGFVLPVLNIALSAPVAGRVFLAAMVLLFGFGFLVLVRSLQGRPTAVELIGFAWAYGYFTYSGYIGYVFTLGVAFLTLGLAHRWIGRDGPVGTGRLVALTGLATAVGLLHLFGWIVLAGSLGMMFLAQVHRRCWGRAFTVAATLSPSVAILAWYTSLAWRTLVGEQSRTEAYKSIADKQISLIDSVLLFLRPDPFPPVAPMLFTNLVVLGCLALIIFASRARKGDRVSRLGSVRAAAVMFAVIAIAWPFGTLNGMGRPDERMALPAILLAVASLPYRRASRLSSKIAALPVIAILALHTVQFHRGSGQIEDLLAMVRRTVPPDDTFLSMVIWEGRAKGGCGDATAMPSLGQPTLRWVLLEHLITIDRYRTSIMESGLLLGEFYHNQPEYKFFIDPAKNVPRIFQAMSRPGVIPIPWVIAIGCEQVLLTAKSSSGNYTLIDQTDIGMVFRSR